MKKRTKVAAAVLAAALSTSALAGCGLTTTNVTKDYAQVIAEVNITNSANFAESEFSEYADVIETADITKRDMVAYFISTGYSMMQSYGWSYYDTFTMISETLVNRQIYLQYAMLYLMNDESEEYSADGYRAAVAEAEEGEKSLAALAYFLTDEEKAKALYDTRVLFNSTLDSQETTFIKEEEGEESSETARTTPTGANTEDEEYYNEAYRIYTGSNAAADCAGYEVQDGSTPTTRRKAYSAFLASLRQNDLISQGEKLNDMESLSYFKIELENAYEAALIEKMSDKFEDEIRATVTEADAKEEYDKTYSDQQLAFAADLESFTSALDGVSDTSFVLTAPEANYGYVINILLPFSTSDSQKLEDTPVDQFDTQGNNFARRADLLKKLTATDQRGTWFTGSEDYSFRVTSESKVDNVYTGADAASTPDREYLFFEEGLTDDTQYEKIPNYYGRYTYNGKVKEDGDEYVLTPASVTIDDFIAEMEGYLTQASSAVTVGSKYTLGEKGYVTAIADDKYTFATDNTAYYSRNPSAYYNADKTVDYSKFVYYAGKVDFGTDGFNANEMFEEGTAENVAFSVINELSFAYNTDTAGLNSYLGYSVTTGKTSYMAEFEYAAQLACRLGAGSYVIVPTDYGWHIIYCTFSFVSDGEGGVADPYKLDWSQKDTEGTFSYLFYEALVADYVSDYANNLQSYAVDEFLDCATVYEDRYSDLLNLDLES